MEETVYGSISKLKKLKDTSHVTYAVAAEKAQSDVQKRQEAAEQMKWRLDCENTNLQETLKVT